MTRSDVHKKMIRHSSEDRSNRRVRDTESDRAETRSFYNRISHIYDLLSGWSEAPMRKQGLRMLAPRSGEKLLEIGFGTGRCLIELAAAVGRNGAVHGVDLADQMVKHARRLVETEAVEGRIALAVGDACKLPYRSHSFDAVFMSFTLELFGPDEIPIVLAEIQRVLRTGGRLGVVSMSDEGDYRLTVEVLEWLHQRFPKILDCRPISVGQALESAGFSVGDWKITKHWVPIECVVAASA